MFSFGHCFVGSTVRKPQQEPKDDHRSCDQQYLVPAALVRKEMEHAHRVTAVPSTVKTCPTF